MTMYLYVGFSHSVKPDGFEKIKDLELFGVAIDELVVSKYTTENIPKNIAANSYFFGSMTGTNSLDNVIKDDKELKLRYSDLLVSKHIEANYIEELKPYVNEILDSEDRQYYFEFGEIIRKISEQFETVQLLLRWEPDRTDIVKVNVQKTTFSLDYIDLIMFERELLTIKHTNLTAWHRKNLNV